MLTLNDQPVFTIGYASKEGKTPWPSSYVRIFRPWKKHEGTRSKNPGELMLVRRSKLVHSKDKKDAK